MATQIEWKKKFFSDTYTLFADGIGIGVLKSKSLSGNGVGEYRGKNFDFITAGFFKQNTWISNKSQDGVLANIKFDMWRTKAEIIYLGKKYIWKTESAWSTTMSISCDDRMLLKMSGSSTKGVIEIFGEEDEMLILACLFLINYYWQIFAAAMVAVFVPTITNLSRVLSE